MLLSNRSAQSSPNFTRFGPDRICLSLGTVIGWRAISDLGAGGVFDLDPLWPGLAVSVVVLLGLNQLWSGRTTEVPLER